MRFIKGIADSGACASAFLVLCCISGVLAQTIEPVPPATPQSVLQTSASQRSAISTSPGSYSTVQVAADSQGSPYIISPRDLLDISVYEVPELSQKVRVSSQGEIDLPLVNYVHVAGLTIDEAQLSVQNALKAGNFMTHPHVEISILEYGSGANVMGEVARPGIYPVAGSRRLLDLLTAAGGVTSTAGKEVEITHKDSPKVHQLVQLSNNPKKAMDADVDVYQGDTVIVTRAGVVYVVGEVLSPSGFLLDDRSDYTVVKVLAMAHGPTKIAKMGQARIVRRTQQGLTEIPVPLDKIIAQKTPDVPVQADDILFVPASTGKQVGYASINIATGLVGAVGVVAATRGIP